MAHEQFPVPQLQFSKRIFSCISIATTKQYTRLRRAFTTRTKRIAFGNATAAAAAATSNLTLSLTSPCYRVSSLTLSLTTLCSGWEQGDVFELQEESSGHALTALCEELLGGGKSCFELDAAPLTAFCGVLERDFSDNPHHNSVHGTGVLLTVQLLMHSASC